MLPGDPSAVAGTKIERQSLRRAWVFARPYKWAIVGFLTSILVSALMALAPPLLFRAILDHSIPQRNKGQITVLAAFLVAAALGDAVLAILQRWYSSRIGEGLIYDLRVALFDKVQQMPIAFFTRTQTGALISRLNNDVVGAQTAVTSTLGSVVSNVVVLITTLAAMLTLEWRLTLLSLVVLPLFIIPAKRVGAKLQTIAREQMGLNAEMNTQMTERFNVSGALLVKLFGRHNEEVGAFSRRAGRVRDIGIRSALYGRVFFVALGLVGAVGAAAIYGVGAHLVVDGGITAGTLVAMAAFVQRIYQPLTGLTNARIEVMTAFVSFERVFEVLDAPVSIQDAPGAIDLVSARGELELRNVTFRYPPGHTVSIASLEAAGAMQGVDPDTDVLQNISLHVQPGETIALVGVSGAGKSTLASLIPRLYDATSGSILIDGQDVKNLTQRSVQNAIGVVSQDPHLFHESIGANLRYAKPDATDDELRAACEGAQIYDTISSLPEGFNTLVGERGYRMSGGEKQRLAIARLLLKDPAIMILDEATSHLDNENEAAVQVALEEALRGRTALVIAHRLSTVRHADRIVVLDAGHLVEEGTHEELMERNGLYAAQVHAGELGQ
ncbi:MAG: ABC transporter ATP-binding protein [Actinobacteria bacterium]|nr:ATP-binding cassette domain-containing protein [Actinomycetota bacterium]MTH93366.1 ATP-binding cassette domain-containing protein [Actinomycetota bacterium]NDG66857.1 ABC transporter ATP-binding protein [Actinomycetota bacterium]